MLNFQKNQLKRVPVFIETVHQDPMYSDIRICDKLRMELFKRHVSPLPYAKSIMELLSIRKSMLSRGAEPGLFIVNLFWIDNVISEYDELMGEVPTIFFKRELMSQRSSVLDLKKMTTQTFFAKLKPRLTIMLNYGPKNSNKIAASVADQIITFLDNGDFCCLEKINSSW